VFRTLTGVSHSVLKLPPLLTFGLFMGQNWATSTLQASLRSAAAASSHVEFANVSSLDLSTFVTFCTSRFASLSHQTFKDYLEGFLAYTTVADGVRDQLRIGVSLLQRSPPDPDLGDLDYVVLYQLCSSLDSSFTWDDCSGVKLRLDESSGSGGSREKVRARRATLDPRCLLISPPLQVLLGCCAKLGDGMSEAEVAQRIEAFGALLARNEDAKVGVGLGEEERKPPATIPDDLSTHSDDKKLAAFETVAHFAPPPESPAAFVFTAGGAAPSHAPKASSKCMHLIRAAFRAMPKDGAGGASPKQIAHFGQYMGLEWVISVHETTGQHVMDGDEVPAGGMKEHALAKFAGRRLAPVADAVISECGKGYLAAM
jgi:hypothetical protein